MRDTANIPASQGDQGSQLAQALAYLEKVLIDGVRHGFFECSIACEIIQGGKRSLVIRAGKSHKFVIPEGDLQH